MRADVLALALNMSESVKNEATVCNHSYVCPLWKSECDVVHDLDRQGRVRYTNSPRFKS